MARNLTFQIFRHLPADAASRPRLETFVLNETEGMTLHLALMRIREEHAPDLLFDAGCRSGTCGSCALLVNGRPALACRTRAAALPDAVTLLPLPFFKLVGDLAVDTGAWFEAMRTRVESWLHARHPFDPAKPEARMATATAERIQELDRCNECGCCLAACGAASMREDFLGAAGLLRIARFRADPRDTRADAQHFDLVGDDAGIFGCLGLLACQDVCPQGLPLQDQLAALRRRLATHALRRLLPTRLLARRAGGAAPHAPRRGK